MADVRFDWDLFFNKVEGAHAMVFDGKKKIMRGINLWAIASI